MNKIHLEQYTTINKDFVASEIVLINNHRSDRILITI